MKMKGVWKATLVAMTLALIGLPMAQAGTIQTRQRVDQIIAQQQQIRAEAKQGTRGWDNIPQAKRGELMTKQDRLFKLLDGKQTIGDLPETEQVEVANTLEWIKALANNAEDERQVCQRERQTGSNMPTTVCRTVADMRRQRETSKDVYRQGEAMTHMQPKMGTP